jgi:D-serine deaminase-like pyridoxal phosphate-dependent protein
MSLSDLSTPAAVVDLDVVERNAARMADAHGAWGCG